MNKIAFVGIDRGIVDHWIYQDAEYFKVWFEILYRTRFGKEPHNELVDGQIIEVNYGEFIFGRIKWSERLKVSEQRLRTLIKKLKKENMIEVVLEHHKCTLYRVINYEKFNQQSNQKSDYTGQGISEDTNQQINQQLTSSQPSANHLLTTKEQSKQREQGKQGKEIKNRHSFETYTLNSELIETLNSFVESRKKTKSPMTEQAIKLLLTELNKLADSDSEKIKILNQSILNGWKSVYEIKKKGESNVKQFRQTGKTPIPINKPPKDEVTDAEYEEILKLAKELEG